MGYVKKVLLSHPWSAEGTWFQAHIRSIDRGALRDQNPKVSCVNRSAYYDDIVRILIICLVQIRI